MKGKIFSILFALVLVLSLSLVTAVPAAANTIASSKIVFQGTTAFPLTYNGDGTYSGVIPCVVDGGYDIYAKEGATAWFGDDPGSGPVWTSVTIANHDAFLPNPTWDPDTPDWYQYSLNLYEEDGVQKWAIRNHPGATADHPWYDDAHWGSDKPPMGVPMSGTMDWNAMYAMETDTGAYLPSTGTPEIPGGAATKGGGAGYWDMDWSWGSEAVPLQFPGFDVTVTGSSPNYTVTLTPAAAGATQLTVDVPDIVAISVDPTSIDFGSLVPGQTSSEYNILVKNVGTHKVNVSADVESGGSAMVRNNLELKPSGGAWGDYRPWPSIITGLTINSSQTLETRLTVPSTHTPAGAEIATLTFTATGT